MNRQKLTREQAWSVGALLTAPGFYARTVDDRAWDGPYASLAEAERRSAGRVIVEIKAASER